MATLPKYRNIKTDGYSSRKEAKRAAELKLMEKAGVISNLEFQPEFELIPAQWRYGKVVERAAKYIGDFSYIEGDKLVIEDVKSDATKTPVYILKKKLMLQIYDIQIREV